MTKKLFDKYRYSAILLRELVITDFKLRYQGSALGYLWSLLRPLFLFVILYVVFVYFLKIGGDIPHWPVAMLLGIVMWNFFAEVTNQGLKSVVGSGGIIRKINFPKYVILFATSLSAFINLIINLLVVGVFMLINGVEFSWTMLYAPVFILEIFIFGLGLAFILSTIYVKFRDVNYIWEIVMQALFYGSAVLFPVVKVLEMNATAGHVLLLNPAAQAIQDAREAVIPALSAGVSSSIFMTLVPLGISIVTIVFGAWLFKKRSPRFAEDI
ncbi:MAG: ABC transporter permease [Candidatus Saccharibacteria bacterium]|nr:MAG: ABC transporter permease [Candidatus Saccharibacteria bacterium]